MKKVTYLQKGRECNFMRFGDRLVTVFISRTFDLSPVRRTIKPARHRRRGFYCKQITKEGYI